MSFLTEGVTECLAVVDMTAAERLAVVDTAAADCLAGINNWLLANKSMFAIRVFLCAGRVTSDLLASLVSIDGAVFGKLVHLLMILKLIKFFLYHLLTSRKL